jgi:ribosomal protein L37AE/L43A
MQIDPVQEWQRLTALYREMGDVELRELAMQYGDLTEQAQHVLRDELKKRGIPDPLAPSKPASGSTSRPGPLNPDEWSEPQSKDETTDGDASAEFTWKTLLCHCETTEEAWQLTQALRRAGIDAWAENPDGRGGVVLPRVVVGADQLEEARVVAAQPIPQDILDDSKADVPQYEVPACPKCGEPDPILEGADPVNTWLCEACGSQWSDPGGDSGGEVANDEKNGLRSGKSRPATGQLFP